MTLALYGHPFSSYTQKVLIALDEYGLACEFRCIAPEYPEHIGDWLRRWPLRKFPLLLDGERQVTETSIIIEHLPLAHAVATRLIPDDPTDALQVRFMDRMFDQHVMSPVQAAVAGALGRDGLDKDGARAAAAEKLEFVYGWLEGELVGRSWACGDAFTMADCAAAPSLFYADWTHPIGDGYPLLRAYRARLLARPSVARAVDGGRPHRYLFPLGAPDRD